MHLFEEKTDNTEANQAQHYFIPAGLLSSLNKATQIPRKALPLRTLTSCSSTQFVKPTTNIWRACFSFIAISLSARLISIPRPSLRHTNRKFLHKTASPLRRRRNTLFTQSANFICASAQGRECLLLNSPHVAIVTQAASKRCSSLPIALNRNTMIAPRGFALNDVLRAQINVTLIF